VDEVDAGQTNAIRRTVTVRVPPEVAFRLFIEGMDTWWPVDLYSRAVSEFEADHVTVERLEVQPRLGGSILEHLSDGRVLPWAEVTAWEPPRRVVLAWRPHSLPEPPTEIEATFTPRDSGTVVEIEHRGWERLSPGFRRALYDVYVRGWVTTLDRYTAAANRTPD
jgi:uncharacterized protein YndB with AHSA1/START domain